MLSVREITHSDVNKVVDYWLSRTPQQLLTMGADPLLLPSRNDLTNSLMSQLDSSYENKKSYCIIWEHEGLAIGHCNTHPIKYGDHAFMHLHLWRDDLGAKGLGTELVKMSVPYFFNNLALSTIFCQPKSDNEAPNRTLHKAGFQFVKHYTTIPGSINFEQVVALWRKDRDGVL